MSLPHLPHPPHRFHRPRGGDDGEPKLRRERGAAVAVQGVPPRAAGAGGPALFCCAARSTIRSMASAASICPPTTTPCVPWPRWPRGDARRALSTLELVADYLETRGGDAPDAGVGEGGREPPPLLYDKSGEEHYNVVSAFIKSMRGSDPDAAIYWMMRMLEAGDDPLFVSRRMLIFASEDVGNADARAMLVASAADATLRRVGMPEGMYPLAQACLYLATRAEVERVQRGVAPGQGARREARRARRPEEAAKRGDEADEGRGLRRGLQVRARASRAAWSRARRTCPRSSRARCSTSRPTAARRCASRSGSRAIRKRAKSDA